MPLLGPALDVKQVPQRRIAGLDAAGICFPASALLGLSKGHARAVIARYALMETPTIFRLEWTNARTAAVKAGLGAKLAANAFSVVQAEKGVGPRLRRPPFGSWRSNGLPADERG
jgi:hypothetical protein